jgi:hypothetical protein
MAAHTFSSPLRAAKRRGNPYGPWMAFRHAFALAARNDDYFNQRFLKSHSGKIGYLCTRFQNLRIRLNRLV